MLSRARPRKRIPAGVPVQWGQGQQPGIRIDELLQKYVLEGVTIWSEARGRFLLFFVGGVRVPEGFDPLRAHAERGIRGASSAYFTALIHRCLVSQASDGCLLRRALSHL